jgi:hypothetical protein
LLLIDRHSRATGQSMSERDISRSTYVAIKPMLMRITASPRFWKLGLRLAELTSAQPVAAADRCRLTVASVWSVALEHQLLDHAGWQRAWSYCGTPATSPVRWPCTSNPPVVDHASNEARCPNRTWLPYRRWLDGSPGGDTALHATSTIRTAVVALAQHISGSAGLMLMVPAGSDQRRI